MQRLHAHLILALLGSVALSAPSRSALASAAATGAKLSPRQARAEARRLYLEAERKYSVGEFHEAHRLFSKAYEHLPLPGFLFNIGQCERMLSRYKKAIFLYRRYLQKKPDAPNRALVERLIKESQQALEERRRRAAVRRVVVPPPRPFMPPPRATATPVPVYKRWWLWTLVGVGVAAVATGLALGLSGGTRALDPGSLVTIDLRPAP